MPNHVVSVSRAAKTALATVILAVTVMPQQIVHASAQMNQPHIGCAFATLPELGKEPAPIKQAALPQHRYTAGIVTGGPQSTDFAIAYEIAKALDTGPGPHNEKALRVTPIVGSGGIQNIVDLLTLPAPTWQLRPRCC